MVMPWDRLQLRGRLTQAASPTMPSQTPSIPPARTSTRADPVEPLERGADVDRPQRLPVRVAEVSQPEGVGASGVGRCRHRLREIGHEHEGPDARGAVVEVHERVVRHPHGVARRPAARECWVDRRVQSTSHQPQRAASVRGEGRRCRCPEPVGSGGQRDRAAAGRYTAEHRVGVGVDLDQSAGRVRHPDVAAGDRDRARRTADGNGAGDRRGRRVDARDGAVEAVRHPDTAPADRHSRGA